MNQHYPRRGPAAGLRHLALTALLALGAAAAHAQALPYTAANTVNTAGAFADLGTAGTAIATPNTDDANSGAENIGFSFAYNGQNFTQFVLNTNGFIKLGATAPAAPFFSAGPQDNTSGPVNSTTETDLVLPFNTDLTSGVSGATEYRVATTGAPGRQVCTIQWKNVADKPTGTFGNQYANFTFQVKLYEANSQIDFVYGPAVTGAGPDNFRYVNVGVKGAGTAANQVVLAVKASVQAWSATTFIQGTYPPATNTHNVRSTVLPDPGRTYSFVPPAATDASVQIVYGYDRLAVPAGQPLAIQAVIRNAGTAPLTNVVASLTVTGANSFTAAPQTVASLAVGASAVVTFPDVAVPNLGNNTVTVSVPSDDNNTNNSKARLMETNISTFSYRTATMPSGNSVFGLTGEAYYAAKITLTAPRNITAVTALISGAGPSSTSKTSVGESVYGVVVNATTGAILARSPNYVITAADIDVQHTFVLSAPATVPAGDVLVGMAQVPTTATGVNFFPFGVQNEVPTRPNTFFAGPVTPPTAPTPVFTAAATAIFKFPFEAITAAVPTCPQPASLTVTGTTATTVTVALAAAAGATGYQLVYGPVGFVPGPGSSTSPTFAGTTYTLTGLTPGTGYDFYVRALCSGTDQSGLTGPARSSTACTPPTVSAFPYTQNFDVIDPGQALPCGITVSDDNNDGFTWRPRGAVPSVPNSTGIARSAPNAMVYVFNGNDVTVGANDWFYTPALALTAGQRYRLSFYYRGPAGSGYTNGLEVKYGPSATAAGQTTTLFTNNAITNATYALANNTSTPAVADITAAPGTYYVGFHAISGGDQGFLAVDDLTIAAGPLATSEALKRAVAVFPNPSASGVFNLEIHGANARRGLAVEVTNALGQRVYTGAAPDNQRTALDLSALAPGLYHLTVRNGQEFTMQAIAIAK